MATSKIKKGDTVKVIAGNRKIKNKEGKVISVDPKNGKVLVEGLNKKVRFAKKTGEVID